MNATPRAGACIYDRNLSDLPTTDASSNLLDCGAGLNRPAREYLDTGTDILYLYDGWQVVEEREYDAGDTAWEARRQYVYGGQYVDEPLIFDKDTDDDGVCDDTRYYYSQQANYNVVALTEDDGDIVEKVLYDPYGEATVWLAGNDGNWGTGDDVFQSTSSVDNPYLFQGRRWDSEADLYYFRNRSYSPRLGRFMQRDPVGYVDGMNLYEFVAGAPVCEVDPEAHGVEGGKAVTKAAGKMMLVAAELGCAHVYDKCLKKANRELVRCLGTCNLCAPGHDVDACIAMCQGAFNIDVNYCMVQYVVCGLASLTPFSVLFGS